MQEEAFVRRGAEMRLVLPPGDPHLREPRDARRRLALARDYWLHLSDHHGGDRLSEVNPDRETAGTVFYGVARPISVPAPIALGATLMTLLLD
jgi:hypothetical protein